MLVDRCWLCLEQPAITTVIGRDGRSYPLCDVCAIEHPQGPDVSADHITDEDLRRIVGS